MHINRDLWDGWTQDYEEVIIPPAKAIPPRATERLIPVSELDLLPRGCFPVRCSRFGDVALLD